MLVDGPEQSGPAARERERSRSRSKSPKSRRMDAPPNQSPAHDESIMNQIVGKMTTVFTDQFQEHKRVIDAAFQAQNQELGLRLSNQDNTLAGFDQRLKQVEERPQAVDLIPTAALLQMDQLWALEKTLISSTCEGSVLISNLFDTNKNPMPEISRKPVLDKAIAEIKIKPDSINNLMVDNKITQFTKLQFKTQELANKFMSGWIKEAKPKNGAGAPIFAKADLPTEVRRWRLPMVQAEKALKAFYRDQKQSKDVRIRWSKNIIVVDGTQVARRTPTGEVAWADPTLATNIQPFLKRGTK